MTAALNSAPVVDGFTVRDLTPSQQVRAYGGTPSIVTLTTSISLSMSCLRAPDCCAVAVADVGCGHGASTVLMAQAYPQSTFAGFDYHEGSIATARKRAEQAGVSGRVKFEIAKAKDYPGGGYSLVTFFDCLHDMGDPVGAASHVRESLAADGSWMPYRRIVRRIVSTPARWPAIAGRWRARAHRRFPSMTIVEPFAGDAVGDNLNPIGRAFYCVSTLVCTPASLSQEVGLALGAQAGEARMRQVVTSAGFTRFRRATQTPFNLIYEARP